MLDARSELPPLPSLDADGLIITGFPAMVTDRPAWLDGTTVWLRNVVAAGMPTLGVCFGHQLLAHALGGTVGWNPGGRAYGTIRIDQLEAGGPDPLLGGLPPTFAAHSSIMRAYLERHRVEGAAVAPSEAGRILERFGAAFR